MMKLSDLQAKMIDKSSLEGIVKYVCPSPLLSVVEGQGFHDITFYDDVRDFMYQHNLTLDEIFFKDCPYEDIPESTFVAAIERAASDNLENHEYFKRKLTLHIINSITDKKVKVSSK